MTLRIGCSVLLGLIVAMPAWAQTHPLRGPDPSVGAVEPDQPLRPKCRSWCLARRKCRRRSRHRSRPLGLRPKKKPRPIAY